MPNRLVCAIVLVCVMTGLASAANPQLIAKLKELGTAVDNISKHISGAATEAEAQQLANVIRDALDKGLKDMRPTIVITASQGVCRVTIDTPEWSLWSEAHAGKVVDHGAKVH